MRNPYRMQPVVRTYVASPVRWGREPVLRELMSNPARAAEWPRWVELACGHARRDTDQVYGNETAIRVRAGLRAFFESRGLEQKPRKCRCYECAKPERK